MSLGNKDPTGEQVNNNLRWQYNKHEKKRTTAHKPHVDWIVSIIEALGWTERTETQILVSRWGQTLDLKPYEITIVCLFIYLLELFCTSLLASPIQISSHI